MNYFKRTFQKLFTTDTHEAEKYLAETLIYKSQPYIGNEASESNPQLETFRLTDSGVDREGDVILSAGVDTAHWESFGSVLWGHRATTPDLVLGAPDRVIRNEMSIDAVLRFATAEDNPTGAMVHRMIRSGLVRGGSVGIIIREWNEASDRAGFFPMNVIRSELLEYSITPIPANPRAVHQEFESEEEQKEVCRIVERSVEELCEVTPEEEQAALETIRALKGNPVTCVPAASNKGLAAFINRLAKGE